MEPKLWKTRGGPAISDGAGKSGTACGDELGAWLPVGSAAASCDCVGGRYRPGTNNPGSPETQEGGTGKTHGTTSNRLLSRTPAGLRPGMFQLHFWHITWFSIHQRDGD